MLRLNEDLKNGVYRRAYLLYGEESYLKRQYRDRLIAALADPEDEMNVSRFEGALIDPKEIIDLAETLPFFAQRRLIIVEDSGFFGAAKKGAGAGKKKGGAGPGAELAACLSELPDTTVLIFVEENADRRGKLYKAVRALGGDAEFHTQKPDVLKRWIRQILKKEKKSITPEALEAFLTCSGSSMETISRELEKLISYALDRDTIETEDVNAVCSGQTEERIFKMIDAIAEKKKHEALSMYADLLHLRISPVRILALIERQFHILMQTENLSKKGYSRAVIAAQTGVRDFAVPKNQAQMRRFGGGQLTGLLRLCVRTDEEIKSGRIDAQLGVELLIISCMEGTEDE